MSDLNVSMDELLDVGLDSLADMPEFYVPPKGAYTGIIKSLEQKEIAGKPSIELVLVITATDELEDPSEQEPTAGVETSQVFNMATAFGQGSFKELVLAPDGLAERLECNTMRELFEEAVGTEVSFVTSYRTAKDDKTKRYLDVKKLSVVD